MELLGEEYEDILKDIQIEVKLPSTDNSDKFRVWAHGDLTGEIHKKGNNGLVATIKQLEPHNTMDIRTTFDPALINSSLISKKTSENSFDNILNIEENRAEEANRQRQAMKKTFNTFYVLSGIYTIVLVAAWIYVYLKYDKEYKSTFHAQYYREFSDEYNVEVIDYLFHKSITENAMSASILNLIYKKNIKIEEIPRKQKKKSIHLS